MTQFTWNAQRERAASLVADNAMSDEKMAAELGVSRRQLIRWRQAPVFNDRVRDIVASYAEALKGQGIAERLNRVRALDDRWRRMREVIEARAGDETLKDIPGGTTGLIVRQLKSAGGMLADEYAVDTGLLKELRAHEEQAAKELGQWIEKADMTSAGQPIAASTESLNDRFNRLTDPDEREAFIERVRAVHAAQQQLAELRRDSDIPGER